MRKGTLSPSNQTRLYPSGRSTVQAPFSSFTLRATHLAMALTQVALAKDFDHVEIDHGVDDD
jgi:hypothetical protein